MTRFDNGSVTALAAYRAARLSSPSDFRGGDAAMGSLALAPDHGDGGQLALPFDEAFDDLLGTWRRYGVVAGHSDRTIAERDGTIRRLRVAGVDPLTATGEQLIDWLHGLPIARSSRATYRAHLRAWFAWLAVTGRRLDNPAALLPPPRAPRGIPHPVSRGELARILAACSDPRAAQTRAYVLLGAYAGLRVHEIARLRAEDLRGRMVTVRGKGGVVATLPLAPVLVRLAETMPRAGWWFPSPGARGHVHRSSVSSAISRAMVRAGVPGVPHALRHFFCTEFLGASGGDLRLTQEAARHSSPVTTAGYTRVSVDRVCAVVEMLPGAI